MDADNITFTADALPEGHPLKRLAAQMDPTHMDGADCWCQPEVGTIGGVEAFSHRGLFRHHTDGADCWCEPRVTRATDGTVTFIAHHVVAECRDVEGD